MRADGGGAGGALRADLCRRTMGEREAPGTKQLKGVRKGQWGVLPGGETGRDVEGEERAARAAAVRPHHNGS